MRDAAEAPRATASAADAPGAVARSLVDAPRLAPLLMAVTGTVTLVEAGLLKGGEGLVLGLALFAIPTVGTTLLGHFLARRAWGFAALSAGASALAHALLGLVMTGTHDGPLVAMIVLVVDAVTLALALPALVACGVLGPRRDLDAGDTLLGVGGAWFVLVQGAKLALVHEAALLFGLALGLAALAVSVQRAIARRAWCARIERGEIAGLRVRADASPEETDDLVPLYGGRRATAILEAFEEVPGPYRGALVARPVARVPAR